MGSQVSGFVKFVNHKFDVMCRENLICSCLNDRSSHLTLINSWRQKALKEKADKKQRHKWYAFNYIY